tara:strand:+ start:171 stop:434 length:264 start_codon:yes stop_codon:yes gene_type:complete
MSDKIPEINFTNFVWLVRKGKTEELKSCEVKFNGLHLFTAIIPHGDIFSKGFAIMESEQLGAKTNIVSGKDPEELFEEKSEISVQVS